MKIENVQTTFGEWIENACLNGISILWPLWCFDKGNCDIHVPIESASKNCSIIIISKMKFNGVPLIIIEDLSFLKWVFITSLVKFWYNRIWVIRTTYILRDWVEVHKTELRYMLSGMAELIGWKSKIKFSTFNGRQRSFTPVSEVFDPYATIHATHFRPFTPVVPVTAAFDYVSKFIKKVRVWKER